MSKNFTISLLCAVLMGVTARAQTRDTTASLRDTMKYGSIEGIVFEAVSKEPLPGATVTILNSKMGVMTDLDGRYRILRAAAGRQSLRAVFFGFKQLTVADRIILPETTNVIDISMQPPPDTGGSGMHWDGMMLCPDRTSSVHYWSGDELRKIPGH
jgi:hypothetical protein